MGYFKVKDGEEMPKQFKTARLLNKLKALEAAEKLGVSQPTLSAWEGERKSPSVESLENMADLYGVTTDFLLGRSDSYMLDSKKPNVSELFISSPPFSEAEPPKEPPLSRSELINQEEIWLEPISPDSDLRRELQGWYQVKDRFVENEYGNRFYLDTYVSKWLAFLIETET